MNPSFEGWMEQYETDDPGWMGWHHQHSSPPPLWAELPMQHDASTEALQAPKLTTRQKRTVRITNTTTSAISTLLRSEQSTQSLRSTAIHLTQATRLTSPQ